MLAFKTSTPAPPYSLLILSTLILSFVLGSCDSPPSGIDTETKPLLDIPAHGPDALPSLNIKSGDPNVRDNSDLPPGYNLLKQYADDHPDEPYIAVVGIWNDKEERYAYKSLPLDFPDEITIEANGDVAYYGYQLEVNDKGTFRILAAFVPPSDKARKLMKEWVQVKDRDVVVAQDSVTSTSNTNNTANKLSNETKGEKDDGKFDVIQSWTDSCQSEVLSNGMTYYYDCDSAVVTTERENEFTEGSGGGWPSGGYSGTGGGIPGGGGTYSSHIITDYPAVRYPYGSNYAEKYPKLTEYLRNKLPLLKDNHTIMTAIQKYTSLTEDEIASDLQWGQGPVIKVEELDDACISCDESTYGLYLENEDPNSLYVDVDLVNEMESLEIGSVFGDAWAFLIGVTILHEYIHFGADYYPGEEGNLFENDVYGQKVTRRNAAIILNQ